MTDDHALFIRVMAPHALGYCECLLCLEEVEEIRLQEAAVLAGRVLNQELPLTTPLMPKGVEHSRNLERVLGSQD